MWLDTVTLRFILSTCKSICLNKQILSKLQQQQKFEQEFTIPTHGKQSKVNISASALIRDNNSSLSMVKFTLINSFQLMSLKDKLLNYPWTFTN